MFPVAILAGGQATRLRPLTNDIPKSMLTFDGRPFIDYQLQLLSRQGVTRVVLCTGHIEDPLRAFVERHSPPGMHVQFSTDGPSPLGTGGALLHALPLLGSDFFVMYGDAYVTCEFRRVQAAYATQVKPALMTVATVDVARSRQVANVSFIDRQLIEYNKRNPSPAMTHFEYGLNIFSDEVFVGWPAAFDLSDLHHQLSLAGELASLEITDPVYEIGSFEGIEEFRKLTALPIRP